MLTTKNRGGFSLLLLLLCVGLLAGCTPPGARALLEGKRLLDANDLTNAIARLELAATLLKTNATAWNYLGVACHRAGQVTNAARAYQQALTLDSDLTEARLNLGSLWFEQSRFDLAKPAFTAYTLRRPQDVEGWLKLGLTQVQTRELTAAEKSFGEVLRLRPKDAQAYNGLGLVALQRSRPQQALQFFAAAAQAAPPYAPALLNLAITLHHTFRDRPQALQRYKQYLAMTPRAADWATVNATAQALEQELARAASPPVSMVVTQSPPAESVLAKPVTNPPARPVVAAKPEPATNAPKPLPVPAPTQTVQAAAAPEIKPVQDAVVQPPPALVNVTSAPPPVLMATAKPESVASPARPPETKRSFLQRINPVSLFKREPKPELRPTPLPGDRPNAVSVATKPAFTSSEPAAMAVQPITEPAETQPVARATPRYPYHSLGTPAPGNRIEAERVFAQGLQAQRAGRLAEALQSYQVATQNDPAYFEAYYNLGLAALQSGNLSQSLLAYEGALAVKPESADARYNFSLGLKQAGYTLDAAGELERLVVSHANDTRARLALANLYAQQLGQPAKAREHYRKVLEIEPRHPQAEAIRYWLVANPR